MTNAGNDGGATTPREVALAGGLAEARDALRRLEHELADRWGRDFARSARQSAEGLLERRAATEPEPEGLEVEIVELDGGERRLRVAGHELVEPLPGAAGLEAIAESIASAHVAAVLSAKAVGVVRPRRFVHVGARSFLLPTTAADDLEAELRAIAEKRDAEVAQALEEAADADVTWQGFEHEADCSEFRACLGCHADMAYRGFLRARAAARRRGGA